MDVQQVGTTGADWPVLGFKVQSRSRPDLKHRVALGESFASCTCEDFFYRGRGPGVYLCDHLKAASVTWGASVAAWEAQRAAAAEPLTVMVTFDPATGKVSTTR